MDTINQEWLNKNSLRAYPLSEDSPRCPTNGAGRRVPGYAVLPNYVIVDFNVTSMGDSTRTALCIRKIVFVGNTITFFFDYSNGGSLQPSVSVNLDNHRTNQSYRFEEVLHKKHYPHQSMTGTITLGDLSRLREDFPEGIYEYRQYDCVFEPTCMRISPVGVTSIRAVNSTTGYGIGPLVGTVRLVAGRNIRFAYDNTDGGAVITIHAEDGAGQQEEGCDCGSTRKVINTINGISANEITFSGGDCVSVATSGNVLKITNTCSKPCCGCAELAFINEKISSIQTAITRLTNYSETLVQHAMEFKTIVGPSENIVINT